MKDLLSKLGLLKVGGLEYKETLSGGKAAAACTYSSSKGELYVIKFLIAPRTDEELEKFKLEAETILSLTKGNVSTVPHAYSGLKKYSKLPVYYYITEFIDGITLWDYIKSHPSTALK